MLQRYPQLTLRPPTGSPKLSELAARLLLSPPPRAEGAARSFFPLRSVTEVARELLDGPEDVTLSSLDLLRLIAAREEELARAGLPVPRLAQRLWAHLLPRPTQLAPLLSRVISDALERQLLGATGQPPWMSAPLTRGQVQATPGTPLRALLELLTTRDAGLELMKTAHAAKVTPWRLLRPHGVTLSPKLMEKLIGCAVKALEPIRTLDAKDARWLSACVDYAKENPSLKVRFADELLRALPQSVDKQEGLRPLVQWFTEHFARNSEGWRALKPESQLRLVDWLGELAYGDFIKLIEQIARSLRQSAAGFDSLEQADKEINRLRRRGDFWSIYKRSFSRMRVLFPSTSISSIEREFKDLLNVCQVEVLGQGEQIEVAIFEIKHLIVAEIFRGVVSEMLIFKNTPEAIQILFEGPVGIDLLRVDARLDPHRVKVFDHRYAWQSIAQRWIFSEGIRVDSGVTRIPNLRTPLVAGQLPLNDESTSAERANGVKSWERDRATAVRAARARYVTPPRSS
ncbi:MAG: hypothetical protein FJ138_08175 [Deltaproteobacteria bacterium]|nr:hypothetical protein [Deltaproteobacteria bacterium]